MITIFALASAHGKSGVAVVRISGPQAFYAATVLAGKLPSPRKAGLRRLFAIDGTFLDEALVLIFEDNASFTGEQVVELQLHGSTAVVRAVLEELGKIEDLRMAEPGEFTRRALENERMDLTQVEGLSDLLEAETEAQRKQALRVLSGAFGSVSEGWRRDLIRVAALLESTIDFADEEVPVDVSSEVIALMDGVITTLSKEVAGTRIAERIRDGFEIAIIGPPNVGKSTLLNALAGRDVAITSKFSGTTRDIIEVRMDLAGLPVTLLDTAGIRAATDFVESVGIDRALDRANAADLRIILLESEGDQPPFPPKREDIVAIGKSDLSKGAGFRLSGKTGEGIDLLIGQITDILECRVQSIGIATRERHKQEMIRALDALDRAKVEVQFGEDRTELAVEELRTAIRALDSLVGRIDVEVILDEIFLSFCIGK